MNHVLGLKLDIYLKCFMFCGKEVYVCPKIGRNFYLKSIPSLNLKKQFSVFTESPRIHKKATVSGYISPIDILFRIIFKILYQ